MHGFLERVEAGELGDPLPVLAYLAGRQVALPPAELNEARRRSMLLLAGSGNVRGDIDVDDRAVKAVAADLFTEERRAELGRGIDELAREARDLPGVREAAVFLAGEPDLAWRLFALGLLAEELG